MSWKSLQEKYKNHVCYPSPTLFFSTMTYQCGCGKYFTEEEADKQREVWREDQKRLMEQ